MKVKINEVDPKEVLNKINKFCGTNFDLEANRDDVLQALSNKWVSIK